jgi:Uma2 family endonuclease
MSTTIKQTKPIARQLDGEWRWAIGDAEWQDYLNLGRFLPSSFRLAFDGRNLEIMVTGALRDDYADALDTFFKAVAGALGIPFKPYRTASWERPEIERAIQADNCYYLDPVKIKKGYAGRARKSNDVRDYPNPDLAIEVDLTSPKADRESIYAALGTAVLWVFDGKVLTMSRLCRNGQYRRVERSGFLPLRADEVPRWLLEDDSRDYDAWTRRIRAWAKRSLKKKRGSA